MANVKSRVSAVASFSPKYLDAGKLPWVEIEEELGLTFDQKQRKEIYNCFVKYEEAFALQQQAPPHEVVMGLEKRLNSLVSEIISLSEIVFDEPESLRVNDFSDTAKAFDFLCLSLSKERNLREDLKNLSDQAAAVNSTLKSQPVVSGKPAKIAPKTAGLVAFIHEALNGDVSEQPARTNPSLSSSFGPVEYSRWGLPIGPKSGKFAEFMSILLKEKITIAMIENAWGHAKENANDRHPIFGKS